MTPLASLARSKNGSSRRKIECAPGECLVEFRNARLGFTLVELLVVIVIIGILTALLSTAFNNTKAKSQKVSCLNNLYRMQLAWRLYFDDNDDWLPLNKSAPGVRNERYFGRPNSSNSWVAGTPKADTTLDNIIRGTLFPYAERSVAVYRCPSDRSTVVGRKDVLRTRSYSISAYMAGDEEGIDPRVKSKESELINPSPDRVFVFVEEHESSAWLGSFHVMPKEKLALSAASWSSTPSDRHNQGCNLTFADGHVEYWKWYWPKKVDLQSKLTSNGQELRDLRRLQECVPKP
jgi:prepilin-type N-terminal cleavage/methylation domain-containing protein/prepilin-type processing-associated H-X9-DG protein